MTKAEWRENINGMIARVPFPKVETPLRNDASSHLKTDGFVSVGIHQRC